MNITERSAKVLAEIEERLAVIAKVTYTVHASTVCRTCEGAGKFLTWRGAKSPQNPTNKTIWCSDCYGKGTQPAQPK